MSTQWSTRVFSRNPVDLPFPEELMDELVVILMQGKNMFGDKVYCYVRLTIRDMKKMRTKMQAKENFNPSDFGTVVAAGRGDPTDEVKAEIAMMYKTLDDKAAPPAQAAPPPQQKAWDEY